VSISISISIIIIAIAIAITIAIFFERHLYSVYPAKGKSESHKSICFCHNMEVMLLYDADVLS
jgi:hypothetical protein